MWTAPAVRDMRRLDKALVQRIHASVHRYAEPRRGDVKRLKGSDESRLRVGPWRVRFITDSEKLFVLRVLPRGQAYK